MPYRKIGNYANVLKSSQTIDARNIRGGTISSQEIIIGVGGTIRSANYDGSSLGWVLKSNGFADFYGDVLIGGDLDITGNTDMSGDLTMSGDLFLSGGGQISTAPLGDPRAQLASGSNAASFRLFTGDGISQNNVSYWSVGALSGGWITTLRAAGDDDDTGDAHGLVFYSADSPVGNLLRIYSDTTTQTFEFNTTGFTTELGGDAGRSLLGNVGCSVYRSTNQSYTTGGWAFVLFNAETDDDNAWHSTGSNTERITVDADGWYMITGMVGLDGVTVTTGNDYRIMLTKNDTTAGAAVGTTSMLGYATGQRVAGSYWPYLTVQAVAKLSANDHVELAVECDVNTSVLANGTQFAVAKLF